jgi:hypothetical protein
MRRCTKQRLRILKANSPKLKFIEIYDKIRANCSDLFLKPDISRKFVAGLRQTFGTSRKLLTRMREGFHSARKSPAGLRKPFGRT